ncbi:hypothetical protein Tco_0718673, partial [Tanacetum coccineum]
KEDRDSSSPKHVNFVNTVTIIRKEDEPKGTHTLEHDATRKINHSTTIEEEETIKKESKGFETVIKEVESSDIGRNYETHKDKREIGKEGEWMEYEEPLNLVDVRNDEVYGSLIEKMLSCSLNFDFRIEKGDPSNLKIPCMIGCKFIANANIDLDSPMNVMS